MMIDPGKADRYNRLLSAAARLFARWGFDKTSVDDIAREAGVSKGGVYLEFSNKDALFKAVVYRELSRYTEDWLRRFEQVPEEWSFARMIQHSIAAVNANPFIKALMTRDQRVYGSFLQRNPELLALVVSMRAELFTRLQQAGAVRDDITAPVLAYLLSVIGFGMVAGAEVIPEAHRVPFEDALGALGLLLDRGLSPSQGANKKAARDCLIVMVEKMRATLHDRLPGPGKMGAR
jgi:TetR/AcrR family acrAB operon transcriptional repressor